MIVAYVLCPLCFPVPFVSCLLWCGIADLVRPSWQYKTPYKSQKKQPPLLVLKNSVSLCHLHVLSTFADFVVDIRIYFHVGFFAV